MINFMSQLYWVMECSDIWSNVVKGSSLRVFGLTLAFKLVGWVKKIALPNGVGRYQCVEDMSRTERLLIRGTHSCLTSTWSCSISFLLILDSNFRLESWGFWELEPTVFAFCFVVLCFLMETIHWFLAFRGREGICIDFPVASCCQLWLLELVNLQNCEG